MYTYVCILAYMGGFSRARQRVDRLERFVGPRLSFESLQGSDRARGGIQNCVAGGEVPAITWALRDGECGEV